MKQLQEEWRQANYTFFKGRMHPPVLGFHASKVLAGLWKGGKERRLSLHQNLLSEGDWGKVREVLLHEMAHQYVEEVLHITEESAHGTSFKQVCKERGIDYRGSGKLRSASSGTGSEEQKILRRVRKLLALSESTNQFEAEQAMAKAQELLLRHQLSLECFDEEREYLSCRLGEVGRRNTIKSLVASILSRFFFVEVIWVPGYDIRQDKKGKILEISGSRENIEIASYVHDFLHREGEILWKKYKKEKGIKGNMHRRTFIQGVLSGFASGLEKQKKSQEEKGLIWVGDPGLLRYYALRNPRIQRKSLRYGTTSPLVYAHGRAEGESLKLKKGIHRSPSVRFLSEQEGGSNKRIS